MRKKEEIKHYKNNKMAGIATYLSILVLKVNGLNSLIKRHRLEDVDLKKDPHIYCL
jgi:hypothetical protein